MCTFDLGLFSRKLCRKHLNLVLSRQSETFYLQNYTFQAFHETPILVLA